MRELKRILAILCLTLFLLPLMVAAVPLEQPINSNSDDNWWNDTTLDRNQNKIGDMIEKHMQNPIFLDDDNTLPLIIDYSYTPGLEEIESLEIDYGYIHQFELPSIDALAGRVPVNELNNLKEAPGVVMLELDGILTIANGDARAGHGVDFAFEETGYDGSGTTVAIIDTGLDGNHSSIDDQDDDPLTNDPKILAFYDAVNNAGNTNGTDFPYDDHGHGSHCGGTTAGTGAPTYEHVGMAPQAHLVGVKVLDGGGSGSFGGVMAGMQWTIDTMHSYNTRAASMSLGGPGAIEWTSSEEDSVNRMANEMTRSGIALFIAAGNNGVSGQIGTPGSAEDVITVGALDKDTGIAIYSSQGPTEEGRIKPNIAYMGSSIISVEANSGDQYVGMSGTSMATPGAAGVGALMLQANPDLSPFDIRNIMQETATYRQCHYMGKNEPCTEDLIPKNRQNNVYGHGHTNALEAVIEAAEYEDWAFNKNITLNISTQANQNGNIQLGPGDHVVLDITGGGHIDTIQWMSNDLRDGWSNIHSYEHTSQVSLSYNEIKHELEHLPDVNLYGNHTLSMRALQGTSSSPLITFDILLEENSQNVIDDSSSSSQMVLYSAVTIAILLTVVILASILKGEEESMAYEHDKDIAEIVEAEIVD